MIKDFEIKNFRGIQSLKLEGFSNVNIFVGKPNTGKTSILEAIHFYLSGNPDGFFPVSASRGLMDSEEIFEGFFYKYNIGENIVLKTKSNETKITFNQSQKFNIDNNGHQITGLIFEDGNNKMLINRISPNRFEAELQNPKNNPTNKIVEFVPCAPSIRYENLARNLETMVMIREKRKKLSEICKNFSKDIEDIRLVRNKIMVEKKNLSRDIDLRLMGNGFQSYISIFSSILFEPQYILIDEIENGLHFESIDLLLGAILEASNDIQFFITTHNEELLKHLSALLEDRQKESVSVFNVYINKDSNIQVGRYSQEDFIVNIDCKNEIRD
ncbi:hypothetical protein CQA66_05045 [Helicobacter aurati]|uniref:ATPase AAA-type core domain-containing protein n=1 Tax=Helicobacter aurati TaxID=137778 RepID=A0A3D8J4L9_9HELI|nr:AAA family ATPase [Helicobacter aurati]RDU72429.1 hypothetical protein CQA66_05045 [Helicobacter aurati]